MEWEAQREWDWRENRDGVRVERESWAKSFREEENRWTQGEITGKWSAFSFFFFCWRDILVGEAQNGVGYNCKICVGRETEVKVFDKMTQRDMSNEMDNNNISDWKDAKENNTNAIDFKKDINVDALGERT